MGRVSPAEDSGLGATGRIGAALKAARRARRLTLVELADRVGVTKGYVSKVERGLAAPSMATLVRLCEALELPVGSLFDDAASTEVVRATEYPRIEFGGTDMTEYLLTPAGERRVQVLCSEIAPGGGSGDEAYELPIDVTVVVVQTGSLTLEFPPDPPIELSAGDAMTFDPTRPHTFSAGPGGARCLWVMAPGLPGAPQLTRP